MTRYEKEKQRRLAKVARFKKAYEMRQEGALWRIIGEALGVSHERARQMAGYYERCLNGGSYLDGIKL